MKHFFVKITFINAVVASIFSGDLQSLRDFDPHRDMASTIVIACVNKIVVFGPKRIARHSWVSLGDSSAPVPDQPGLKTQVARTVLGEIESALVSVRRDGLSLSPIAKAFDELLKHITPSILAGSQDEQSDMKTLCEYFLKRTGYSKGEFCGVLRTHCASCCDSIPSGDHVMRATVLFNYLDFFEPAVIVDFFPEHSSLNLVVAQAVFKGAQRFLQALQLSFVDKTQVAPRAFIFASPGTFSRFEHFCFEAPGLFRFCSENSISQIENTLWQYGWDYWKQNYQTIWVDREGKTSIRIKNVGEITVGFLSKSPYYLNRSFVRRLDHDYLAARESELLKCAMVGRVPFFVPASLNNAITGYWTVPYGKKRDGIMGSAHGRVRPVAAAA